MATDIPSNILLFKTITMPLTQIPSTEPVTSIDYLENKIVDRSSNWALEISDAFAHIAGGPNNIVGVTTNHTVHSTDFQVLGTTPSFPVSLPSTQSHGL